MARPLPPHDLLDDPVAALDYPDQHQKVKRQGADIRPHRRDGAAPCIDRRRTGRERRKNDAGQRNDQTLQAYPRIAAQEPFCPPERTAGTVRVAVPASAGAPWAVAVSAAAAPASAPCFRRRRRSPPQLFSSPMVHQLYVPDYSNKKAALRFP